MECSPWSVWLCSWRTDHVYPGRRNGTPARRPAQLSPCDESVEWLLAVLPLQRKEAKTIHSFICGIHILLDMYWGIAAFRLVVIRIVRYFFRPKVLQLLDWFVGSGTKISSFGWEPHVKWITNTLYTVLLNIPYISTTVPFSIGDHVG